LGKAFFSAPDSFRVRSFYPPVTFFLSFFSYDVFPTPIMISPMHCPFPFSRPLFFFSLFRKYNTSLNFLCSSLSEPSSYVCLSRLFHLMTRCPNFLDCSVFGAVGPVDPRVFPFYIPLFVLCLRYRDFSPNEFSGLSGLPLFFTSLIFCPRGALISRTHQRSAMYLKLRTNSWAQSVPFFLVLSP